MARLWVGVLLLASSNSLPLYPTLSLSPASGDYTAISSMELTFSDSMLSQTVPITIADGGVVEGNETFSVTLATSDTAVILNPMTATVDILDDDSKLSVHKISLCVRV